MVDKSQTIQFSSLFETSQIICQIPEMQRDDAIYKILETISAKKNIGDIKEIYKAIIERERQQSTVMAPGLAIPHARVDSVDNITIGIATTSQGIDFYHKDGKVKVIFLILIPSSAPGSFFQAMSSLATIFSKENVIESLGNYDDPMKVWEFFERGGILLPQYVCAGDVMEKDIPFLKEDETLEHAINAFVEHNLSKIPVVNDNKELVGEVSVLGLMKVCLPEYFLWTGDLSSILNFEPFAQVLKSEKKEGLAKILSTDFITVSEDTPAVQVAITLVRCEAKDIYVTREKKLVGTITMSTLIKKVLRG